MMKSRTSLHDSSRNSPDSSDENLEAHSPTEGKISSKSNGSSDENMAERGRKEGSTVSKDGVTRSN